MKPALGVLLTVIGGNIVLMTLWNLINQEDCQGSIACSFVTAKFTSNLMIALEVLVGCVILAIGVAFTRKKD